LQPHNFSQTQRKFSILRLEAFNINNSMDNPTTKEAPLSQLTVLTNPYAKKTKEAPLLTVQIQDEKCPAQTNIGSMTLA
jgi:hypothetical protein